MNHIGHISFERQGRDMRLRCNHCGSEETVAEFESGGRPRRFGLGAFGRGDQEFAKCHQCLLVHDRGPQAVPSHRARFRPAGLK